MHCAYQIMRRNPQTGGLTTWAGQLYDSVEEAAEVISKEGNGGQHFVVVPVDGHPEYTVEETVSRTMHKLPVLVGRV